MPRVFLIELVTASTHVGWPPSELYAIWNAPDHGEMASAWAHSFFASSGLYASTSEPSSLSDQPSMTGEVKSLAGVRVSLKTTLVISGRLIDMEIAWRRSWPSSPEKCGRRSGTVKDWKIAAGWLTARSPSSDWKVASADARLPSITST